MTLSMDAAGHLVIPEDIRQKAGLQPGMPLDIHWNNGRIEIEPLYFPVRLIRRGRFLVAVPEGEINLLTTETVAETRAAVEEQRFLLS